MLIRLGPSLAILLLIGPILFGLVGTLLPAFGYLPALGGREFSLRPLAELAARPAILSSALMSFVCGIATAGIALVAVMLFVAGWAGTRTFSRILHLVSPLLSVPHAAAAFGLAFLIAPSGMIARVVSPELTGWMRPPDILIVRDPFGLTMMAGLIVKEIPFLLLVTLAALPQVKLPQARALAASLGYGRMAGFLIGQWPQIYRQIRLAVFAVIAFASSVVDVAAILGPTTPAPLSVRLLQWMNDPDLSMRYLASAGALLQLVVTGTALAAWLGVERIGALIRDHAAAAGRRYRHDTAPRRIALTIMAAAAVIVIAGLATLAIWSVAGLWPFPDVLPGSFMLKSWRDVVPHVLRPLGITLAVAALSSVLAVVLCLLWLAREDETGRRQRGALGLIYLPLIVPQVAFLFGLQLFFLVTDSIASFGALVLAHLTFVLPYVFLSLSDPWRAFDRRYDTVVAGLGKHRRAGLISVRIPMLARAILVAAAVGFAVSVSQYLPTVLIGAGRLPTITTEAVALAAGGNRRIIGVYAFLQMMLPTLGFLIATLAPALIFRRFRAMRV